MCALTPPLPTIDIIRQSGNFLRNLEAASEPSSTQSPGSSLIGQNRFYAHPWVGAQDGSSTRSGEKFFKETRKREMETQVKSTQSLVVIAHFINTGKEKKVKRHGLILQRTSLLAEKMGCLNEIPDTMCGNGGGGDLRTQILPHHLLRCPQSGGREEMETTHENKTC